MMDEEENKIEKSDGLYLRIYDFLVQHPQLPEVALDSLTRLIGLVLHIHVAPIGIQDFLDEFPVKIKQQLGWKKENENVKKSSPKKIKPS